MSNLKFNKELVDNYKSSFDSAKTSFNSDSYNTFKNSYLATCSDSTVQSMYNNLDSLYSDIDRGYNSINDYWTNYNEDNSSLESSLKTDSNVCTNSNVNSFLSSFLGGVSNAQSPTIELYNGTKNSFESTNNSENTDDLVFRYNANTELSDQINIDDDLTYKPGEDSNNKELLNEETGYDDKIIEYGMTAEELEENLNNNLNDLELLYAEKFKELHKLEEELEKYETERMDYDPRSKEWDKSEELRNQIAEKKEELAAIKNQIQQTENQINLIPYYNLVYNDDYDEVLSTIDTEDIANYSMEELQSDYGVTKGAKGYNTLVDPLLVAESVKEHFPDKSDEELAFDYSILNISDESFTEMTYLDVYNYTTPEQRNIYHYLWKTQGREAADAYLLLLLDNINQSKGYYQAMQYISTLDLNDKGELETSLANYFDVSVKGLGDGIGTFYDGITENLLDDGTFTADEYEKMYVLYYLSENSDYYDEIYGFHSSVGNMLPAIGISMATSFVGTTFGASTITIGGKEIALGELAGSTALGLSSYGNAKHEALHNGVSVFEANVYAICIGMSETLLDYKLGNIKWISKSSSMKFFDLAKEGFTEAAQEYIQQGLDYGLLGKDIDLSTMTADAGKSFLFGVLLSCYFNGSGKAFKVTYNGIKYTIDPKTSIEYFNENKDASLDKILNESSVGNEEATTLGKNNAPKDNQGVSNVLKNNKGSVMISPFGIFEKMANKITDLVYGTSSNTNPNTSNNSNAIPIDNTNKYSKANITNLYENDRNAIIFMFAESGISPIDTNTILNYYDKDTVIAAMCETDEIKRKNNMDTLVINLNSTHDVNSFLQNKFAMSETNTFNISNNSNNYREVEVTADNTKAVEEARKVLQKKGYSTEEINYLKSNSTDASFITQSQTLPNEADLVTFYGNSLSALGYSDAEIAELFQIKNGNIFDIINFVESPACNISHKVIDGYNISSENKAIFYNNYKGIESHKYNNKVQDYYVFSVSDKQRVLIPTNFNSENIRYDTNYILENYYAVCNSTLGQNNGDIVFLDEDYHRDKEKKNGATPYATKGNTLLVFPSAAYTKKEKIVSIIFHESTHSYEYASRREGGIISTDPKYAEARAKDNNFTSDYARDTYEGKTNQHYKRTNDLSEDVAELVYYIRYYGFEDAKEEFPNRMKYLEQYYPELYNFLSNY